MAWTGGNGERQEGHAEVRQEHHRDRQEVEGIHGRGTSRDEGARPRAQGRSAPRPAREEGQAGRGTRRACEDRGDAGTGSRHGRAAPCPHQGRRAGPIAEDLVSPGSAPRRCAGRSSKPPRRPARAADRCARTSNASPNAAAARSPKVAVARKILTLCYYGLRDGEIRCLKRSAGRARWKSWRPAMTAAAPLVAPPARRQLAPSRASSFLCLASPAKDGRRLD
jgi:hypothetical protein